MFGILTQKNVGINMKEAQKELEKDENIVLIDVRTREEYLQGHIKGSINIPLNLLPVLMEEKVSDRNARIFVYCLSGGRSSQACRWMIGNGFTDVTNIGGISSWNGPIVRG